MKKLHWLLIKMKTKLIFTLSVVHKNGGQQVLMDSTKCPRYGSKTELMEQKTLRGELKELKLPLEINHVVFFPTQHQEMDYGMKFYVNHLSLEEVSRLQTERIHAYTSLQSRFMDIQFLKILYPLVRSLTTKKIK